MVTKVFSMIFWSVLLTANVLFFETGYSAETKTDVTVRFSKHEGFNRIVFEASDESFIKNTVVTSTQNQIKIQFPSTISLKTQGKLDIETSFRERTYVINLNSPFNIKVLKLPLPPRLSIDIMTLTYEESGRSAAFEGSTIAIIPNIRIVLDPGHGGYDSGILSGDLSAKGGSAGGGREKDITLAVARSMEGALIRRNKTVYLTRKVDQFLSITDRALFANQKSPDVFISVHLSLSDSFVIYTYPAESAGSDVVNELYSLMSRQRRYTEKSKALAEGLGKALKDEFKKDIIYRKMELPLLASVGAASVMVEIPGTIFSDQALKTKLSDTLLKGIAYYANQ